MAYIVYDIYISSYSVRIPSLALPVASVTNRIKSINKKNFFFLRYYMNISQYTILKKILNDNESKKN